MTPVRTTVIGYGSIGARHAAVLASLGCEVSIVTRRTDVKGIVSYGEIGPAIARHQPSYVVIANETAEHRHALGSVARSGFGGAVLVEKPLFESATPLPSNRFAGAFVGYNLRFHPLLERMKALLASEAAVAACAYVGQYLPSWRPTTDYRRSYSASAVRGGGVIRDLSHEIDSVTWLLGEWVEATAMGGHVSDLEIDSDDVFSILMRTRRCQHVSIHLNYLDRVARRTLTIMTNCHTYVADLRNGNFSIDGKIEHVLVEPNETYTRQHAAILSGNTVNACTFAEGLELVSLIDRIERVSGAEWIRR